MRSVLSAHSAGQLVPWRSAMALSVSPQRTTYWPAPAVLDATLTARASTTRTRITGWRRYPPACAGEVRSVPAGPVIGPPDRAGEVMGSPACVEGAERAGVS